ncbi:MAG: tetratricopeptide repeat protein [Candidatus Omnitrophica bacterium]|nr:tetratricopeptide repeat protein [Candidatus Omnitrophota bacterium]
MGKKSRFRKLSKETRAPSEGSLSFFERIDTRFLAVALVLLVVGIYANAVGGTFVWDDQTLVVRNDATRSFSNIPYIFENEFTNMANYKGRIYRPLQESSYMVDRFLYGLDASGFHITSIILQIGCTLALFYVVFSILGSRFIAFFSAMIFGLHPINTEAVTYISGRSDPLYLLFLLLAFLMYIRSSIKRGLASVIYISASLFFYACSLLSRETAVIFPLLLASYEVYGIGDKARKNILRIVPFVALIVIYAIFRAGIVKSGSLQSGGLDALTAVFINSKILVRSLAILLVPIGLHMWDTFGISYSINGGEFFLNMALMVFLGFLAAVMIKKDHRIIFWIFWFFILLLPHLNIVKLNAPFAEHWLYGASIGIYVTIGIILYGMIARRVIPATAVYTVLAVIALYLSVFTITRNSEWKDEPSIYNNTLKYIKSPKVFTNLGVCYEIKGEYDKSVEAHKKAIAMSPNVALYQNNIAIAYAKKGDEKMALEHWKRSLALEPDQPEVVKFVKRIEP